MLDNISAINIYAIFKNLTSTIQRSTNSYDGKTFYFISFFAFVLIVVNVGELLLEYKNRKDVTPISLNQSK